MHCFIPRCSSYLKEVGVWVFKQTEKKHLQISLVMPASRWDISSTCNKNAGVRSLEKLPFSLNVVV